MFTSSSGTVTGPADVTDLSQPGVQEDEEMSVEAMRSSPLGGSRSGTWTEHSDVNILQLVFSWISGSSCL